MGTIIRAVIIYWFLLVVLRIVGRRSFEQMTPFEMILVFLLGGIGMQAIVVDDRSLTNALLGISAIALMHIFVAWLKMHSEAFRRFLDATPIVIVEDGHWHEDRIHRLRLHTQDIMAVARGDGLERLDQIGAAMRTWTPGEKCTAGGSWGSGSPAAAVSVCSIRTARAERKGHGACSTVV